MASVYSSFVGPTKMLLAKKQFLLGRGKKKKKTHQSQFKHFLQGSVNLKEIKKKVKWCL